MKCDQCDQEATVHELRVVNGKKIETHLCQRCARERGIDAQPTISVPELLHKYLQHAAEAAKPGLASPPSVQIGKTTACHVCGTGYLQFRQTGLLGCPHCYVAFEHPLSSLLERAHQGGTHHVGKVPRRALTGARAAGPGAQRLEALLGGAAQRAGRLAALRKQLDEAVRAEQYERAARIRDEIRRMQELEGPAPHEGGGAATA